MVRAPAAQAECEFDDRAFLIIGHSPNTKVTRSSQSSTCRWLLMQWLQQLQAGRNDHWALSHSDNGAPVLLINGEPSDYRLSISHSANYYAVALSKNHRVAVDIEVHGSRRNYAALSDYLNWPIQPVNEASFLARWTLWEACAKLASQSMLSKQLKGFDELSAVTQLGKLKSTRDWRVLQLQLGLHASCTFLLQRNGFESGLESGRESGTDAFASQACSPIWPTNCAEPTSHQAQAAIGL